jgi:hypothetical protein
MPWKTVGDVGRLNWSDSSSDDTSVHPVSATGCAGSFRPPTAVEYQQTAFLIWI